MQQLTRIPDHIQCRDPFRLCGDCHDCSCSPAHVSYERIFAIYANEELLGSRRLLLANTQEKLSDMRPSDNWLDCRRDLPAAIGDKHRILQ